jgi:transposase
MRWLSDIKMPHRSQQVVLQEYIGTLNQCKDRVKRLTDQIQQLLPEWQRCFRWFKRFRACAVFQ